MPAPLPRYPIYIPSKGRADHCLTAQFLLRDEVPFKIVVEPQERDAYAAHFGNEHLLVLPFSNQGSVVPARNWIRDHSMGYKRHWQLDDNISHVRRRWRVKRIPCDSRFAFTAVEDFVDRYENVAIAGLAYRFFVINGVKLPPIEYETELLDSSEKRIIKSTAAQVTQRQVTK